MAAAGPGAAPGGPAGGATSGLNCDSVRERLATEHGIVLVHPACRRYHVELCTAPRIDARRRLR